MHRFWWLFLGVLLLGGCRLWAEYGSAKGGDPLQDLGGTDSADGGSPAMDGASSDAVQVLQVVGGRSFTCARYARHGKTDTKCWGRNDRGQLGTIAGRNASQIDSALPLPVAFEGERPSAPMAQLAAGVDHACLLVDGAPYCWGDDGVGDAPEEGYAAKARLVRPSSDYQQLALGEGFSCGLQSGGQIDCWGDNSLGQLGRPPSDPGENTVELHSGEQLLAGKLACGQRHCCAVTRAAGTDTDRVVYCWGRDGRGDPNIPGYGERPTSVAVPANMSVWPEVSHLAAGDSFTCAAINAPNGGSAVYCWGAHNSYRLARTDGKSSATPVAIDLGLSGGGVVTALELGENFACALIAKHAEVSLHCWGNNQSNQVFGPDDVFQESVLPRKLEIGKIVPTQLACGHGHACISDGSAIHCWGGNLFGELGAEAGIAKLAAPDEVPLLAGWSAVAAGGAHTCALSRDGDLYCWGTLANGAVGAMQTEERTQARPGVALQLPLEFSAISVAAGGSHSCVASKDRRVACWGANDYRQVGPSQQIEEPFHRHLINCSDVDALSLGARHSCAIADGHVYCWGNDRQGELGRGAPGTQSPHPEKVLSLPTEAAHLAVGPTASCAVVQNDLYCWGENRGQIIGASAGNVARPTRVAMDQGQQLRLTQSAVGEAHACALTDDGDIYCWGDNHHGQLGRESTTKEDLEPAPINAKGMGGGWASVVANGLVTCAITKGGELYCWGDNAYYQLANTGTDSAIPQKVEGLRDVEQVSVGFRHVCAVTGDGGLYCWGAGFRGALGTGMSGAEPGLHHAPLDVPG